VWRGGRGPDLRPRTVAGVEKPFGLEPGYGLLIQLYALGLAYDGTVPVEPDGAEIRELRLLYSGPYP
jgi:hypothetical protein